MWEEPPITPNDILIGQHNPPPQPEQKTKVNPRHLLRGVQNKIKEFGAKSFHNCISSWRYLYDYGLNVPGIPRKGLIVQLRGWWTQSLNYPTQLHRCFDKNVAIKVILCI